MLAPYCLLNPEFDLEVPSFLLTLAPGFELRLGIANGSGMVTPRLSAVCFTFGHFAKLGFKLLLWCTHELPP